MPSILLVITLSLRQRSSLNHGDFLNSQLLLITPSNEAMSKQGHTQSNAGKYYGAKSSLGYNRLRCRHRILNRSSVIANAALNGRTLL